MSAAATQTIDLSDSGEFPGRGPDIPKVPARGGSRPPGRPPDRCATGVEDEEPKFIVTLQRALGEEIALSVGELRFLPPIRIDTMPGHLLTISGPVSWEENDGVVIRYRGDERVVRVAHTLDIPAGATGDFALIGEALHHVSVGEPELLPHAIAATVREI